MRILKKNIIMRKYIAVSIFLMGGLNAYAMDAPTDYNRISDILARPLIKFDEREIEEELAELMGGTLQTSISKNLSVEDEYELMRQEMEIISSEEESELKALERELELEEQQKIQIIDKLTASEILEDFVIVEKDILPLAISQPSLFTTLLSYLPFWKKK